MSLNVTDLTKGSALSVCRKDYLVESSLQLGTGKEINVNHKLKDGDEVLWLCLRNHCKTVLIAAQQVTEFSSPTHGDILLWQDREYRRVGGGTLRSIGPSEQGYNRFINLEYIDYCQGSHWLLLIKQGSMLTALAGEEICPSSVVIYGKPGR